MESTTSKPVAGSSSGLSLQVLSARSRPPGSATPGAASFTDESEGSEDVFTEQYCFYEQHLRSRRLEVDDERDPFLLEHRVSGHSTSCNPLAVSVADDIVLTAPAGEELPFDRVHCLTPVDIREPLLSPRHIRLLKLYPWTYSNARSEADNAWHYKRVRCEVYQASLDDLSLKGTPLFAAASYVCGDQTPVQVIRCGWDRKHVTVPRNVYDVLLHLRFENRPRLLWIDYLCIKQHDDREKSHQVRMLHEIYTQAHVVSWLGTARDTDAQTVLIYLDMIARLYTIAVRTPANRRMSILDVAEVAAKQFEEHLLGHSKMSLQVCSRLLQTLTTVYTSKYFERLWIVQEIILGKSNACQLGIAVHSLAVLAAGAFVLDVLTCSSRRQGIISSAEPFEIDQLVFERAGINLKPALHGYWSRQDTPEFHDLDVVRTLSTKKCSDPRDAIYGVASLFQHADAYIVNYKLSVPEVFADFTAYCLLSTASVSVLNGNRWTMAIPFWSRTQGVRQSDLPSWCPDWAMERPEDRQFDPREHTHLGWQASGQINVAHYRPSRLTLSLRGLAVSSLRLCTSSYFGPEIRGKSYSHWLTWFEPCRELCTFLELQGLQLNAGLKDLILTIFDRVLIPKRWHLREPLVSCWLVAFSDSLSPPGFTESMRTLLDQSDPDDRVRDLLVPVYLAQVDPELFRVAELMIDARIPPNDYLAIEEFVRQLINLYSVPSRLFVTENGMYGVGYPSIREGDLVCIIYGSDTPQILRQVDDHGHFILIGACNVDGLMYGEGLEMGLTEQDFILV